MMNLDDMLDQLRSEPPHPRLAALDDAVLAKIGLVRPAEARAPLLVAAAAALALGLAGGVLPSVESGSATAAVPLGAPGPLAPSALLGG